MTDVDVSTALARLPLTRLTHFTPVINLWPILRDGMLRSSKDLAENASGAFTPTDHERYDAHPEHVCCSFEYPNVYYLREARKKPQFANYRDWACLLLERDLLLRDGALFAPCNAAKHHGAHLDEGGQALLRCWANPSQPSNWRRNARHHRAAPTDVQAEALIPGPIMLSDVHAIVLPTDAAANEMYALYRRNQLRPERVQWKVAPALFDVTTLVNRLRNGGEIEERFWTPEGAA